MRNHPELALKLSLLYELDLNPAVRSNAALARALGLSKQSVSKWTRGTSTSLGDQIPRAQVNAVSTLYGIDSLWWSLSYTDFESNVRDLASANSKQLVAKPEDISLSLLPITNAEVFGREKETEFLLNACNNDSVNFVQMTGFGGVGKSTAVNAWLSKLALKNYLNFTRVYAWSFYWQGASSDIKSSGDFFIEHALSWFADPNPIEGTPWNKATRLAKLVRSSNTLLILDGLEPLQYGPGPKIGQIDNPAVSLLVKELACENSGLCVVTSRLPIADVTSFDDGRVRTLSVEHLEDTSSEALLRSLGVSGSDEDFKQAISIYSGHALSLSLLAGYLRVVHQGDLARFRDLNSLLDNKTEGAHARSLLKAYVDWYSGTIEQELLFLLGLFDRGVELKQIQLLCETVKIEGLTIKLNKALNADWMYAIKQLIDSRIITQDSRRGEIILDCHPIVRDFVCEFLQMNHSKIWQEGNSALFIHLQEVAVFAPESMIELEPLFRAVLHGTRAGLFEESFAVYFEYIKHGQFSMSTIGSHYMDQACLRSFFQNKSLFDEVMLSGDSKYFILSSAATNAAYLGEIEKSVSLSQKSIKWYVSESKWIEAVGMAAPLVSMYIFGGYLEKAIAVIENLDESVKMANNPIISSMALSFLAYTKFLSGEIRLAKQLFEKSEKTLIKLDPMCPVYFPTISAYYCKFLLDIYGPDIALERALKTQSWRKNKAWQVELDTTSILASDLIVLASIFLAKKDYRNAKVYMDQQVELLKSASEWLYLPAGLNARALYYIQVGEYERAETDLDEALEIANRTGALFGVWECFINFTHLNIARSDWKTAFEFLGSAKSLSRMSSYKFRNQEIEMLSDLLEQKNALIMHKD